MTKCAASVGCLGGCCGFVLRNRVLQADLESMTKQYIATKQQLLYERAEAAALVHGTNSVREQSDACCIAPLSPYELVCIRTWRTRRGRPRCESRSLKRSYVAASRSGMRCATRSRWVSACVRSSFILRGVAC